MPAAAAPARQKRRRRRRLSSLMLVAALALAFLAHRASAFRAAVLPAAAGTLSGSRAPSPASTSTSLRLSPSSGSSSAAAQNLLYQDQQGALARRAADEEELLGDCAELTAPKLSSAKKAARPVRSSSSSGGGGGGGGGGFGGGATKKEKRAKRKTKEQLLAVEQAFVVERDGVLRIDEAMSPDLCDRLRRHVLKEQEVAEAETLANLDLSQSYYGVENQRKQRCDLQLSLCAGENDDGNDEDADIDGDYYVIADALKGLLGRDGSLRHVYEELVGLEGEFYEFAAIITDPGADRQQVHPDLPYNDVAPLYVIFVALQDVNADMGPTTFLLGTHTREGSSAFLDPARKDEQLRSSDSRLALLKKGDAVLFDARVLHCGNANDPETGDTRAMFNFSFRNPKVSGDLGYDGSMRPDYVSKMKLGDVADALDAYDNSSPAASSHQEDPFAKYGHGI